MNKKLMIKVVLIVIVMLIVGYFFSYVKTDKRIYENDVSYQQITLGNTVYKENDFEYTFTCEENELTGLEFYFMDLHDETGAIVYTLTDEEGNQIVSESMKVSDFRQGLFTTLDFDTIKNSKGQIYTISISCQNAREQSIGIGAVNDGTKTVAMKYTYIKWDIETMIVFMICNIYLLTFSIILVRIFRK